MALELRMITVDCTDPRALASFWTAALGVRIAADYGGFLMLEPPPAGGTALGFQQVPEPRTGKNRLHADFVAADREAEVQRLVGLGATKLTEMSHPGIAWTVLADPEGNEFCVAELGAH